MAKGHSYSRTKRNMMRPKILIAGKFVNYLDQTSNDLHRYNTSAVQFLRGHRVPTYNRSAIDIEHNAITHKFIDPGPGLFEGTLLTDPQFRFQRKKSFCGLAVRF